MGRRPRTIEDQSYHGQEKRSYARCSKKTKERLISLVLVQDKSVVSAAKRCKIKESTAKMAIKAYKDKLKKNSNQNLIRNVKTGSRSQGNPSSEKIFIKEQEIETEAKVPHVKLEPVQTIQQQFPNIPFEYEMQMIANPSRFFMGFYPSYFTSS